MSRLLEKDERPPLQHARFNLKLHCPRALSPPIIPGPPDLLVAQMVPEPQEVGPLPAGADVGRVPVRESAAWIPLDGWRRPEGDPSDFLGMVACHLDRDSR